MKRRFKRIAAALIALLLFFIPVTAEARLMDDDYPPPHAVNERVEVRLIYYGSCTITHYCWCAACCGRAGHPTASGVNPIAGVTVANGELPFGTVILLNGQKYIVHDRGVNGKWIDIFVSSHAEADARGMYQADVYIIERLNDEG